MGVACFVVLGGFVVGFFLLGKFDLNHMLIPVVDRPCLALVRQCRKKKEKFSVLPLPFCGWDVEKEKGFRMLATSFTEAAGVAGRQKWSACFCQK